MSDTLLTVQAQVVAAFVDERDGGNLAAVVLDRPDLSEAQMQSIAAQLGFPESAFVTDVPDGFRFDVFTPNRRVPDCGHATIAAFGLLATTIKQTTVGPRTIRVAADGSVVMQQPPASFTEVVDAHAIAASLGLQADCFASIPIVARNDVAFLLAPFGRAHDLVTIVPDMPAIQAISNRLDVYGYYVYAPADGVDATIRMFAPRIAIPEESATGMAAGMLAGYLHATRPDRPTLLRFDQGVFMQPPSPSRLNATIEREGDVVTAIWVGGYARTREVRTLVV